MSAGEEDDPPTFSRPPPQPSSGEGGRRISDQAIPSPLISESGFSVAPHRTPVFSAIDLGSPTIKDDDDDGPTTDVDDGPPTFSIAPAGPGRAVGDVTLVNAAPPHERLTARVVTVDATHLFVKVDGEPVARRISRTKCFEHPVGGGWSTWRLSGADRERWMIEVAPVANEGSA